MAAARHLTTDELAERLGVKPHTIRLWREQDRGPAYIKDGGKFVRYRLADVEAWEKSRLITPGWPEGSG
jgi:excisionase family DNA binding protein